jgi:hypothetical protein
VLEALEIKFGDVPVDIASAVNVMTDLPLLKEALRQAIRADSLEIFKKWLGES